MNATVIEMHSRPLTRARVLDFLDQDTYKVLNGVATWWGEQGEVLVATEDRAVAALAADALVRQQVGDSLIEVFGGVVVDQPMSVELVPTAVDLGGTMPGEKVTWRHASRPGSNTVVICRVWAGEDGAK
ncbi:hypothetical protein ACFFX1_11195 [Dactylosporangium sucinum]|uniref:Uncharacterized protein n=1 Tax=Dactylosporangium sucinum TaxID=1424081 RepID=A0A917WR04_9ACTN|nr:hypothetical protein [Dactylosporangium sucinum]GGM22354.1 hypothetical protein GCM10007977_024380 [Dactylosporangium sucinum]